MIIIWDNGGEYSDHRIHFVDTGPFPLEAVEALMAVYARQQPRSRILATAEKLDWRDSAALQSVADWLSWVGSNFEEEEDSAQLKDARLSPLWPLISKHVWWFYRSLR